MLRRFISLGCAALAFAPFAAQGAAGVRQTVVPGRSVGSLVLGMTRTQVWRHYGRPLSSFVCRDGACVDSLAPDGDITVLSQRGRVVQIAVAGPEYRTVSGLSANSTFAAIRPHSRHWRVRLFQFAPEVGGMLLADDVQRGLAFRLGMVHLDNFPVSYLPHSKPDRLIVHRPGVGTHADEDGLWLALAPNWDGEADWPRAVQAWFAAPSRTKKR